MNPRMLLIVAVCAAPGLAGATSCPLKGFEFIAVARDNMWSILSTKTLEGKGACSVLGDSLVVAAAVAGQGVTCEATFFGGATLKGPWKLQKIKFGGADVVFTPPPSLPSQEAQVTVKATVDVAVASSVVVEQVVLTTTESSCKNWRDAVGGEK
jgi:hypothetical protein